jgi:hypothetical protein
MFPEPTYSTLDNGVLIKYQLFKWDVSSKDHAFYEILKHNLLQKEFLALEDRDFVIIDSLMLSNCVVNSTKTSFFEQVPVFSVVNFLQDTYCRFNTIESSSINPFVDHIYLMLRRACLIHEVNDGHSFEKFHAGYEWMKLSVLCHPTLDSFLQSYSKLPPIPLDPTLSEKQQALQSPTTKPREGATRVEMTLNDLYPGFFRIETQNSSNPALHFAHGRFIERSIHWLKTNHLINGDVFVPSEPNNPAFDLMIMTKTPSKAGAGTFVPFLILVECKHSSPTVVDGFGHPDMEKKFLILMEKYNSKNEKFFKCGTVFIPWKNVAYVFLSAHDHLAEPNDESPFEFSGFEGIILASDREIVSQMYGAPLNNCGALLQQVRHLCTEEEMAILSSSSSSSSSALSTASSSSSSSSSLPKPKRKQSRK